MRRSLYIVAAVIAGLVLLATLTVMLLPAERIGALAADKASAALNREVQVERFGIRLLPPAVRLENVNIAGRTPADSALLTASRVELRPKLLPLLRRTVVIDEVRLDQPVLRIEIGEDSVSNLPVFAAADTTAGAEAGSDATIDIRQFRLRDGVIVYRDAVTGTNASLTGIDQKLRLSGSVADGQLAAINAIGDLEIDDIDLDAPALLAWPVRDLRLGLTHDVALDRTADRAVLTDFSLTLQELTLALSGTVTAMSDSLARTLDLRAQTGTIDVANLIASLPRSLLGDGADMLEGVAGSVALDVAIRGRSGAGAVPEISGTLDVDSAALARGRSDPLADGLTGRIAFSLDSITTDGISGRVLGEPFRLAMRVQDLSAPSGRVTVQAAVGLAEAKRIGLLPDSVNASGRVGIELVATGSFVEPASALVNGGIDLTGVRVEAAPLKQPIVIEQGRIDLDGRAMHARDIRATLGTSDIALDFDVTEWLPLALGDTTVAPNVTFDARSTLLDADAILGPPPEGPTYAQLFMARLADRPIGGRTATEAAEELGLRMPELPDIVADGRFRANRYVRRALPLEDVDVALAVRDREIHVRGASFKLMGGGMSLAARLGASSTAADGTVTRPLTLDYSTSDVAASTFLERYAGFRDNIAGNLLLAGKASMVLDEHLLPLRESVASAGTAAILEGEIVNWPLLRGVGDKLGIAQFDTLSFRDWTGQFRIAGTKIVLEESMLESGDLGVRAAGSFDVNGALDLGATLHVPQEWAARVPGAPAAFLTSAAAGADGRVPVGARIGGTARSPQVSVDLSEAGARIANAAREAAQQQAREAAERAAQNLVDRIAPGDSMTAAADSLKKKVEQEVGDRLRRIIRH